MSIPLQSPRPLPYTRTAVLLHWLVALLVIAAFVLGTTMVDLKISPTKLRYFSWHKWLGITVLGLATVRLLWRLGHRPPPLPPMPRWQRLGSELSHWTLYSLLFAIPLSGWAYSSSAGYPVVYLGLLPLPDWVPKDKLLATQLKDVHGLLTTVLWVLVSVHVLAALKHHFFDRDGLLWRMWFARQPTRDAGYSRSSP